MCRFYKKIALNWLGLCNTNKRQRALLVLVFLSLSLPASASRVGKAMEMYDAGNYRKAAELWEKIGSSSSDNGIAFFRIAELHKEGLGFDKNEGYAASYYKRAAEKGYLPAMFALGMLYYIEGSDVIKHKNSSIYWWKRAAELGHKGSMVELAKLYLVDSEKQDVILAREYSRAALSLDPDYEPAKKVFKETSQYYDSMLVRGSRDIHRLSPDSYLLQLASFKTYLEAWLFILEQNLQGAFVHRNIYDNFAITIGPFETAEQSYEQIRSLPESVKRLKPIPRSIEVILYELLPLTQLESIDWLLQSNKQKFTVELLRSDSLIDAYDFVDSNQLSNSGFYRTKLGEIVVVAGLFDDFGSARSVIQQLPSALLSLNPKVRTVETVHQEMDQESIFQNSENSDLSLIQ